MPFRLADGHSSRPLEDREARYVEEQDIMCMGEVK